MGVIWCLITAFGIEFCSFYLWLLNIIESVNELIVVNFESTIFNGSFWTWKLALSIIGVRNKVINPFLLVERFVHTRCHILIPWNCWVVSQIIWELSWKKSKFLRYFFLNLRKMSWTISQKRNFDTKSSFIMKTGNGSANFR